MAAEINTEGRQAPYTSTRFRRALLQFVGGRAVQALARVLLILLLVRILPVEDYGAYMLLVGLSEMVLQLFSFGLLPVGYRFLPEVLTTVSYPRLRGFVASLVALNTLIMVLVTGLLLLAWNQVMPLLGWRDDQLTATRVGAWLFLLVPVFRFAAALLEALLEQGKAQLARALMPTGRVAILALLLVSGTELSIEDILIVDLVVTGCCLLIAWAFLRSSLRALHTADAEGQLPIRQMLRFGWHMAAVDMLGSASSPGALRAAIGSSLGVAGAGLFAFLQSLQRLVSRYLPGVLLRGLIRPVLVARTSTNGNFAVAEAGSGLLFKANLLVIAAASVVIAAGGDDLVAWLSGGKFEHAGMTLLVMFVGLSVIAQRSVIEMIMQITGQTGALRATGLIGPLALVVIWMVAERGLIIAVLTIIIASGIANLVAMAIISRSSAFRIDYRSLAGIAICGGISVGLVLAARMILHPIPAGVIGTAAFAILISGYRPFLAAEAALIERVAGRTAGRIARRYSRPGQLADYVDSR